MLMAIGAALGINYHFEAYPTMAEVVGGGVQTVSWDELKKPDDAATLARSAEGVFARVDIPASDASFTPRQAIVYLPPSYFKDPSHCADVWPARYTSRLACFRETSPDDGSIYSAA